MRGWRASSLNILAMRFYLCQFLASLSLGLVLPILPLLLYQKGVSLWACYCLFAAGPIGSLIVVQKLTTAQNASAFLTYGLGCLTVSHFIYSFLTELDRKSSIVVLALFARLIEGVGCQLIYSISVEVAIK